MIVDVNTDKYFKYNKPNVMMQTQKVQDIEDPTMASRGIVDLL